MKLIILILFIGFSSLAKAELFLDNYGLGYGLLSSGVFTEAVTESGESSIYGSFSYHFLDANIAWAYDKKKWRYHIKTAYTLLPRKSEDGAVDITQWRISFLLGYEPNRRITRKLIFTSGLGVLGTISKGNGGTQTLNNGAGTTVFHRPDNTAHSKLLMLELGLTYQVSKNISYSMDALVNGLFGDRRNLNIYLSLNYFWNEGYKRNLELAKNNMNSENDNAEFQAGELKPKKKRKKRRKKRRRRKKQKQQPEQGS